MFANINGEEIPEYYGKPYIEICNNLPDFSNPPQCEKYKRLGSYKRSCKSSYKRKEREYIIYSAYSCIEGEYTAEKNRRCVKKEKISDYYPGESEFIRGKYLFNNCHLIAHQLLKDESKESEFIVGTRYMNEIGMSQFEMRVKKYLNNKNRINHVLYRVTPIFNDGEQLVRGVQMEAFSVEDYGKEICFNVFVYNVQPGFAICYKYGSGEEDKEWCDKIFSQGIYTDEEKGTQDYIVNTYTNIFHNPSCNCNKANQMKPQNKKVFKGPRQFLEDNGCKPCGICRP